MEEKYEKGGIRFGYATELSELLDSGDIQVWVHGHTHFSGDRVIGRTRVVSNQRGYLDETQNSFRKDFVVTL